MNILVVSIFTIIASFALASNMTYYCDLKQNESEIFLKIIETESDDGSSVSTTAELRVSGQDTKLIPDVKKSSMSVPCFPYRSIEKWTADEFELTAYVDNSFPGRTFSVDLDLPGQSKIQGVCEF